MLICVRYCLYLLKPKADVKRVASLNNKKQYRTIRNRTKIRTTNWTHFLIISGKFTINLRLIFVSAKHLFNGSQVVYSPINFSFYPMTPFRKRQGLLTTSATLPPRRRSVADCLYINNVYLTNGEVRTHRFQMKMWSKDLSRLTNKILLRSKHWYRRV